MQEKIIEIPFNYQNFMDSQKLIWSYSSKKFIQNHVLYTILGILVLSIGLKHDDKNGFPLLTALGGGFVYYILASWMGFYERRVRFFKRIKNYIDRNKQESRCCRFIFSDYGIEYQDHEKLYKLSWPLFRPYLIFKDNIMLTLKDSVW